MRKDNVITVKEEIQVGEYILEKGDKIRVIQERSDWYYQAILDPKSTDIRRIKSYLNSAIGKGEYSIEDRGGENVLNFTQRGWSKVEFFIQPMALEVKEYDG